MIWKRVNEPSRGIWEKVGLVSTFLRATGFERIILFHLRMPREYFERNFGVRAKNCASWKIGFTIRPRLIVICEIAK